MCPLGWIWGNWTSTLQSRFDLVRSGQIDALVGDDISSYAELMRQGLDGNDFSLVSEWSLIWDFYGFILPEGDREWKTLVDQFFDAEAENIIVRE